MGEGIKPRMFFNTVRRFGIWILLSFFLVISIFLLRNPKEDTRLPQERIKNAEEPLILSQPNVSEFERSRLKISLIAENAQIFEQKKTTLLNQIHIQLFDKIESTPNTRIKAHFGEMNSESGILHLWDAVSINMRDGQKLLTEELFFNQNKNIIYNSVSVTLKSENDEITATSMHYDIAQGLLILQKPDAKIKL